MKSIVSQEELSKALSIVSRAVDQKTTLPVLLNIRLDAIDGKMKLTSTNMSMTISTEISSNTTEKGSTTVPNKMLSDLVNTMPNPQISIDLDEIPQNMKMVSGKAVNEIKCVDSREFPKDPVPTDESKKITLDLQAFRNMIRKASVSAYTEEQPKILSGAFLRFDENFLTMGTVDGQRASEGKMPISGVSEPFQAVVPCKNLLEFSRIAPDDEEFVEVFVSGNQTQQIMFKTKKTQFTSNTMEGSFPEYWKVIPSSCKTKIKVSSVAFFKAIKQAEIFSAKSTGVVRIKTEKNLLSDELRVSSSSKEYGANNAAIASETNSTETELMSVSFSVSFVKDIMGAIDTPNAIIELNDPGSAVVIKEEGNTNFVWLMMPRNPKIDDTYEG